MFKSIILLTTSKCNLFCPHCYAPKDTKEMDNNTIIRFLRDAHKEGMEYVCLTGGEPLLRKGFLDLLSQIKDMGYKISLFTNGTLLSRSLSQLLSKFKVLVNVSVDGATSSVAESIRGLGNFKRIIRGMELLKKEKVFYYCILHDQIKFI